MCTVTYIPPELNKDFILTSNRDEVQIRSTIPPKIYVLEGMSVCYPKDTVAGGSWIAINNKGRIVCLLNGAFQNHQKEDHHTQSRGQVLVQLAATEKDAQHYFQEKDLKNTEPFTLITIDIKNKKIKNFSEFIWDGTVKHFRLLKHTKPYIWL